MSRNASGGAQARRLPLWGEEGHVQAFLVTIITGVMILILLAFAAFKFLPVAPGSTGRLFSLPNASVPVSACEVRDGIVRRGSVVNLTVVDRGGRVVAKLTGALVVSVTDGEVWLSLKNENASRLPSGPELAVNRLKVILEPVN